MIQLELGDCTIEVDDQYKDHLEMLSISKDAKFLAEILEERSAFHMVECVRLIEACDPSQYSEVLAKRIYAKALQDTVQFLRSLKKQIKSDA